MAQLGGEPLCLDARTAAVGSCSGLLCEELVGTVLHAGCHTTYLAPLALATAASPVVGAHI